MIFLFFLFFFSSRRRHTRWTGDWSSDVCSSDLAAVWRNAGRSWGPRRNWHRRSLRQPAPGFAGGSPAPSCSAASPWRGISPAEAAAEAGAPARTSAEQRHDDRTPDGQQRVAQGIRDRVAEYRHLAVSGLGDRADGRGGGVGARDYAQQLGRVELEEVPAQVQA